MHVFNFLFCFVFFGFDFCLGWTLFFLFFEFFFSGYYTTLSAPVFSHNGGAFTEPLPLTFTQSNAQGRRKSDHIIIDCHLFALLSPFASRHSLLPISLFFAKVTSTTPSTAQIPAHKGALLLPLQSSMRVVLLQFP